MPSRYTVGWTFLTFVFCWLAAIVRCAMHLCTPVPGGGVGCRLVDLSGVDDGSYVVEVRAETPGTVGQRR